MYHEMLLNTAVKIMKGRTSIRNNELIRGISIDTRNLFPGQLFFALKGEHTDGHKYTTQALKNGAIGVVVQHETQVTNEILVDDTLFALGELARYYRNKYDSRIIAITGTNGKTTVKNLIARSLESKYRVLFTKKSFNSLVGLPLTIFEMSGYEDYVILEMGTNHPGEIKRLCDIAQPLIGIITNIGPGHIKGLGSIDGVKKEKMVLLESLPERGFGIVGASVDGVKDKRLLRVSLNDAEDIRITENGSYFSYQSNKFFTPLLGLDNVFNCLIAITLADRLQIDVMHQQYALSTIAPEPGRLEPIKFNGLLIINDSYNANPNSMRSAIDFIFSLNRRKILVLGDMLELGDESENYHCQIGEYARGHCDLLITFGQYAELYGGIHFIDKDALVNHLRQVLNGDEVILIKASRAMKFEDIVGKLLKRL
ncbi:MAG: UDP-N-acetylmuramoyl-tripeptide--D-alanyl-D-alanine ligase [bacterium]